MSKSEYIVGPDFDQEALDEYARLLDKAYENGKARGAHMDWNDVTAALDKAVDALGGEARLFVEDSQADGWPDDDFVSISFAEGTTTTKEAWSAASLLFAYRYPDDVKWEDVDAAWEALHREPEAGLAP